jgi:hypothetical protein
VLDGWKGEYLFEHVDFFIHSRSRWLDREIINFFLNLDLLWRSVDRSAFIPALC